MQEDMHYYGTYALARAAGISAKKAQVIAYAAQYVDDSTNSDSEVHEDGGMFQTIATAHTNQEVISNAAANHTEQRQVWVPFHFFPGNQGDSLSERLLCRKDSNLAREMVQNHIQHSLQVQDSYALPLLGIMAHVYADTFSHYGFSGVSSRRNEVDGHSFELAVEDEKVKAYIMGKYSSFLTKYAPSFILRNFRNLVSKGASAVTGALGHGAVGTYPDRPFLKWRFRYQSEDNLAEWRDNPQTFLEGCEKLYQAFNQYAKAADIAADAQGFSAIKQAIEEVLRRELAMQDRVAAWIELMESGKLFKFEEGELVHYSKNYWEEQKDNFEALQTSSEMAKLAVYNFHQAAIYHRDYTLKQLLPKHGIVVL
ncbi:MAG: putative transcriptional regulator [Oceanospirillaceae bacterium]|jgi:predicted transcriptional regulator